MLVLNWDRQNQGNSSHVIASFRKGCWGGSPLLLGIEAGQ